MKDVAQTFIAGVIAVAVITALFMNGRQTASTATAVFGGANNLLGTAIKG